ncbi:hypothetical protein [Myxococcus stipitatus]|uniref:hypothetical protein n=1 Tax=Myxococcus stipitatus TaxID=83455 RepID=UPI0030D02C3A
MKEHVEPTVRRCFQRYPRLRSMTLLLAQYWNDEADDAVHYRFVFSELETPDVEASSRAGEEDAVNFATPPGDSFWNDYNHRYIGNWPDNHDAIPAFAAFTREDCHQEMTLGEAYEPYVIFRRTGQDFSMEKVGQMLRPWLDGVKASWDAPE